MTAASTVSTAAKQQWFNVWCSRPTIRQTFENLMRLPGDDFEAVMHTLSGMQRLLWRGWVREMKVRLN